MEQSYNCCCLCRFALESAKAKGKQKNNGRSCTQEREILGKFVETFNLSQSLLPIGGTLCYCCLTKLKKWDKMTTETIIVIQELLLYVILMTSVPD